MYEAQPKRIAVQPAAIGSVLAMVAATKAAVAIGGVIRDMIPKYRMKRCAAIAGTPTLTSAGATRIASITYTASVGRPRPRTMLVMAQIINSNSKFSAPRLTR